MRFLLLNRLTLTSSRLSSCFLSLAFGPLFFSSYMSVDSVNYQPSCYFSWFVCLCLDNDVSVNSFLASLREKEVFSFFSLDTCLYDIEEDRAFVCFRDAHHLRIISVQILLSLFCFSVFPTGKNTREYTHTEKDEGKSAQIGKSLMIEFLLLSVDVSGVCKRKRTIPYRNSSSRWIVKL